jgi:hypothetical protein
VEAVAKLLDAEVAAGSSPSGAGPASPEALRGLFAVPAGRLLAVEQSAPAVRLDVRTAARRDVLEQALLLGLCTNHLFDPARPVLWTTRSLTRALELCDPAGFYA